MRASERKMPVSEGPSISFFHFAPCVVAIPRVLLPPPRGGGGACTALHRDAASPSMGCSNASFPLMVAVNYRFASRTSTLLLSLSLALYLSLSHSLFFRGLFSYRADSSRPMTSDSALDQQRTYLLLLSLSLILILFLSSCSSNPASSADCANCGILRPPPPKKSRLCRRRKKSKLHVWPWATKIRLRAIKNAVYCGRYRRAASSGPGDIFAKMIIAS